jgi:hypothetical protein
MKWMSIYLLGYVLFMGGVLWALGEWGVIEEMGPTWTMIVVLIALGIGVMIAVANSGRKENIQISSK